MGLTFLEGTVVGPAGKRAKVEFLVDSGATYSVLPLAAWTRIGLTALRSLRFRLADGTVMERNVSECKIHLPQGTGHTPVVLGEKDDAALLGVVTFEVLGLILNPFTRTLQPMQMLLA